MDRFAHWPSGIPSFAEAQPFADKLIHKHLGSATEHPYRLLAIPAYGETHDFLVNLKNRHDAHKLVLILHINEPTGSKATDCLRRANQSLVDYIVDQAAVHTRLTNTLSLYQLCSLNVVVISSCGEMGLEPKSAVGLARKIAADFALLLINQAPDLFHRRVFFGDADCVFSHDYFDYVNQTFAEKNPACVLAKLDHDWVFSSAEKNSAISHGLAKSTHLYQRAIEFYQQAIELVCGSYSYVPIGSTITVNADAYAKVRGVPLRAAGEDFYLLNKLNKLTTGHAQSNDLDKGGSLIGPGVVTNSQAQVTAQIRTSSRCPFGTGPSVLATIERNADETNRALTIAYYDWRVFVMLKYFYEWLSAACLTDPKNSADQTDFFSSFELPTVNLSCQNPNLEHEGFSAKLVAKAVKELADTLDARKLYQHLHAQHPLKNSASKQQQERCIQQRTHALFVWYDAFKILKSVHVLRDHYFPNQDYDFDRFSSALHKLRSFTTRSTVL